MSSVTVREIMTLAVLGGTSVLGGAGGLDRLISGVNVMEVPDIERYVKAGELLLTTGYSVRDRPERLTELIGEFAARGLGALAIKPTRYLHALPEGLVAEADRLDFPLLAMPDHTSFNDVISAVLAIVLAEYGAEPGDAEAIRERLTGVALAGGGLDEIARTLAGALDRNVSIVDPETVVLGRGFPLTGIRDVTPEPGESPQPWAFPITVAGAQRGRILVGGRAEPTLGQRRLIRQSCFAAGMHIAQALASLQLDRRMGVLFLEELVSGSPLDEQFVRQRARLLGWDLTTPHVVVLARCDTELPDGPIAVEAARVLSRETLAWSRGQEVVAIAPRNALDSPSVRTGPLDDPAQAWRSALLQLGATHAVVAIGSVASEPAALATSHQTARAALSIARATGRTVAWHEDLAVERLMLTVPPVELRAFVDQAIGPLVAHDAEHFGNLCRTLEEFLGVGNGAEAARRLFIHYNTMKHRMARIADLLGVDLREPQVRLTLALALEVRKLV